MYHTFDIPITTDDITACYVPYATILAYIDRGQVNTWADASPLTDLAFKAKAADTEVYNKHFAHLHPIVKDVESFPAPLNFRFVVGDTVVMVITLYWTAKEVFVDGLYRSSIAVACRAFAGIPDSGLEVIRDRIRFEAPLLPNGTSSGAYARGLARVLASCAGKYLTYTDIQLHIDRMLGLGQGGSL